MWTQSGAARRSHQKVLMVEMKFVGIKCDDMSGPYDLM